jgi:hydroxyacylglutathione hydrolase
MQHSQTIQKHHAPIQAVETFADPNTLENSYVVKTGRGRAVVVDPNLNQGIARRLLELGASEVTVALTHAHPDHICGIPLLTDRFAVKIVCSGRCASRLQDRSCPGIEFLHVMLRMQDMRDGGCREKNFKRMFRPFSARASITFCSMLSLREGAHELRFIPAPGHSPGSCLIVLDGRCVFTGDSLFADRAAVTRFPRSSTRDYVSKALPEIKSLPPTMPAFPGHGPAFILRDGIFPA